MEDGWLRRHDRLAMVIAFFSAAGSVTLSAAAWPYAVRADALRAADLNPGAEPRAFLKALRWFFVRARWVLAAPYGWYWALLADERRNHLPTTVAAGVVTALALLHAARPLSPAPVPARVPDGDLAADAA